MNTKPNLGCVLLYKDEEGNTVAIGPFESIEIAQEWAADQKYECLPLISPEC